MWPAVLGSSDLADLAAEQAGMVSRAQLRALGWTADDVRNQAAAGRWRPHGRQAIALHSGPLTLEALRWLAVLEGGDECAVTGLSALQSHGLSGFEPERVQCAVPLGGLTVRTDWYIRRQSRRLCPDAVHPARTPATVRVGPALVDALEIIGSRVLGCALMAALVQQRLLRPDDLRGLIQPEPTLPGRRVYLGVAGDIGCGAHSLLEIDFRALARRARIPPPLGQSRRVDSAGRVRYLDADFGSFAAEVDGALHLRPLSWWDDMLRQNDVVIAGKPVLRFPSVMIRARPDQVIDQLRRAAARWPIR